MTELDFITRMLEAISAPPPTSLTPPLDTEVETARRLLAQEATRVLGDGWPCNTKLRYSIEVPTVTIGASGGAGTFTWSEPVTHSGGAIGLFNRESGGKLHLIHVSGTWASGGTLTGASANRVGGVYAAVTENNIAAGPDWISVESVDGYDRVTLQDGLLVKLDDAEPYSLLFDAAPTFDLIHSIAYTAIPPKLADHLALEAAVKFQRATKRGNPDDALAIQHRTQAKNRALREKREQSRRSITDTPAARMFKGERHRPY